MEISITVPDEIALALGDRWNDLPRRALEALVVEALEGSLISEPQAQQALGLSSRIELDAFLKSRSVYLDLEEKDLDADRRALNPQEVDRIVLRTSP